MVDGGGAAYTCGMRCIFEGVVLLRHEPKFDLTNLRTDRDQCVAETVELGLLKRDGGGDVVWCDRKTSLYDSCTRPSPKREAVVPCAPRGSPRCASGQGGRNVPCPLIRLARP